jgi:hypothetical protein
MSSTPKGSPWKPALYAFIEDWIAIEMNGQREFREQFMKRYEASAVFRRMIMMLSWCWGIGLLIVAIGTTAMTMLLPETIAFGVAWSTPYACSVVMGVLTVPFVKWSLKKERGVEK